MTATGFASILISTGFASGALGSAGLGSAALGSPVVDAGAGGAAALVALGFVVPPFGFVAEAVGAGGGSDFGVSVFAVATDAAATGDSAGGAASAALGAASGLTAVSVDGLGASVSEGCAPTDCGFSRSFAKVPSLLGHQWPR